LTAGSSQLHRQSPPDGQERLTPSPEGVFFL